MCANFSLFSKSFSHRNVVRSKLQISIVRCACNNIERGEENYIQNCLFDIICQVIEQHTLCIINVRRLPLRQLVVAHWTIHVICKRIRIAFPSPRLWMGQGTLAHCFISFISRNCSNTNNVTVLRLDGTLSYFQYCSLIFFAATTRADLHSH